MDNGPSRLGWGILLAPGAILAGAAIGGMLSAIMVNSTEGWDRLADSLGFVMAGALVGLAASAALALRLSVRALRSAAMISALVAIILSLLAAGRLRSREAGLNQAADTPAATPTVPVY